MAIASAGNKKFQSFTIGKDMSLSIELKNLLGNGQGLTTLDVSDIGLLMEFEANPQHSRIEAKPISHGGRKIFRGRFEHWEGQFTITRTGPTTDLLIQLLQDTLLRSASGTVLCKLTQTVKDPMGGPDTVFVFADAELQPAGGGRYDDGNPVTNSFSFVAPMREIQGVDTNNASISTATGSLAAFLAQLT